MAEYDGEHSLGYDGQCGRVMTEQPPPPPSSWVDLLFWMVSGFFICGLIPTAACAFLPPEALGKCFPIALTIAPLAAVLGGIVAMSCWWIRPRRPPP